MAEMITVEDRNQGCTTGSAILFITNRFPTQSIKSRVGRAFDFDLKNNAASNSIVTGRVFPDDEHRRTSIIRD